MPGLQPLRLTIAVLSLASLSACGGGSGTSDTAANPAGGSSASLSLSESTLAVTADTSGAAPPDSHVQVTIASPPNSGLHYNVHVAGPTVANASFVSQSPGTGQLAITFADPALVGAGTYTDTVQLTACMDTGCTQPINGSPATVTVTYTVTGSALPPPSFYLPQPITGFQAHTADTSSQTTNFNFNIKNVPPDGLYIAITQPSHGFVTSVSDTVSPVSDGSMDVQIVLSLVSPASLGSGFFNSSVTFMVCYDKACAHQVQGSPVTQPIYYVVSLTEGKEYSLRTAGPYGGVTDLAYDRANTQIYVSALSGYSSSPFSGAITQVDPTTGAIGSQVVFNDDLSTVAVSDDGAYLYAGSRDNPVVHRLLLPSLQADLDIPLGSSGDPNTGGGPNVVSQMAVAPGSAHTLLVSLGHPSGNQTAGTEIFDDALARSATLVPLGYNASPDAIAWGSTASSLYAYRYSYQLPFDQEIDSVMANTGGLAVQSSVDLTGGPDAVYEIKYDNGRIYDLGGYVRDAASSAVVGQFQMPGNQSVSMPPDDEIVSMAPDSANGRAFFLVHNETSSHLRLYNFDAATFALLSVIDLGYDNFDVALKPHMIVWGSNGVAANRDGLQILSGSFYAAPEAGSTTGIRASAKRTLGSIRLSPMAAR
jgi:hypothetical protein